MRVEVLCEDLLAWVFIRRALIKAGIQSRQIFKHPFPDSRFNASASGMQAKGDYEIYSCGSQHVRNNYPSRLAQVRALSGSRKAKLVVHIDVDNKEPSRRSVQNREDELNASCTRAGVAITTSTDPVILLIARRELESWIECLRGQPADEHTQYPKLKDCESDCWAEAERFADHARAGTQPDKATPSLVLGLQRFSKL